MKTSAFGTRSRGTLLTLGALLAAAAIAAATVAVHGGPAVTATPDTYTALVSGRVVAHHGIPHTDSLTVLGYGRSWIDIQWLAQLAMYGLWSLGGLHLLAAVWVGLDAAIVVLIALPVLLRTRSPLTAALVGIGVVPVMAPYLTMRPETLALPIGILTFWLLMRMCELGRIERRTWLVAPLIALWANVHASFLLGFGARGLATSTIALPAAHDNDFKTLAKWIGFVLATAFACIASPYGWDTIRYVVNVAANPSIGSYIADWQHAHLPDHTNPGAWEPWVLILGIFVLVSVVRLTRARARKGRTVRLLFCAATAAVLAFGGYYSVRIQPWAAIGLVMLSLPLWETRAARSRGMRYLLALCDALAWALHRHWFHMGAAAWIVVWSVCGVAALIWAFVRRPAARTRVAATTRRGPFAVVSAGLGLALAVVSATILVRSVDRASHHVAQPDVSQPVLAQLHTSFDRRQLLLAPIETADAVLLYVPEFTGRVIFDRRLEIFPNSQAQRLMALTELGSNPDDAKKSGANIVLAGTADGNMFLPLAETGEWAVHQLGTQLVLTKVGDPAVATKQR